MNKKHNTYYKIPGYQALARLSDAEVAKALDIRVTTYRDKIRGASDFFASELVILSELLGVPVGELISTN